MDPVFVQVLGVSSFRVSDPARAWQNIGVMLGSFCTICDLSIVDDADFRLVLYSCPDWFHLVPSCKTCSKACRSDMFAKVKPLRTLLRPVGAGCKATNSDNLIIAS